MSDHHRFGVVPRLELDQHAVATRHVRGIGPVQHQPFPALGDHLLKVRREGGDIGKLALFNRPKHRPVHGGHLLDDLPRPLLERAEGAGQFEDQILQLAPARIGRIGSTKQAAEFVETSTPQPELAIQRHPGRQAPQKLRRHRHALTAAMPERLSVPTGANAIELLADQETRRIDRAFSLNGQQQLGGPWRGPGPEPAWRQHRCQHQGPRSERVAPIQRTHPRRVEVTGRGIPVHDATPWIHGTRQPRSQTQSPSGCRPAQCERAYRSDPEAAHLPLLPCRKNGLIMPRHIYQQMPSLGTPQACPRAI